MSDKLRSKKVGAEYRQYRAGGALEKECVLCLAPILKEFKYWKVIKNDFPYDLIAEVHNMLLPIRHVIETELNEAEKQELLEIKAGYIEQYDYILEGAHKVKSIPQHHHLHLIVSKEISG